MFHMPMSSPMMTTILGFVAACACAGVVAIAAQSGKAAKASTAFPIIFMNCSPDANGFARGTISRPKPLEILDEGPCLHREPAIYLARRDDLWPQTKDAGRGIFGA